MSSAKISWIYVRIARCVGRPKAANALRVGSENTDACWCIDGREANPPWRANAFKSKTWSPIATPGRCSTWEFLEVIMPKGMLNKENGWSAGIGIQDLGGDIVLDFVLFGL